MDTKINFQLISFVLASSKDIYTLRVNLFHLGEARCDGQRAQLPTHVILASLAKRYLYIPSECTHFISVSLAEMNKEPNC